ncbi:NAD(P)H-binding protein [Paenibacillus sp. SEL1]
MNEQQLNDRQGRVGEQYRPEPEIRQVERELGVLYPKGRSRIALTGASGYIGHNLLQRLTEHADVIALSRNGDQRKNTEHVEWRSCDFFSMEDANQGLQGADYAVYLIHSMLPSAKLTQGTFEDMDVILAEHFGRAARNNGVKQIVYLSGIRNENIRFKASAMGRFPLTRQLEPHSNRKKNIGIRRIPIASPKSC